MPESVTPEPQHRWLQRLVGEWEWESDAPATDGESGTLYTGTETVRSLGSLWTVAAGGMHVEGDEPHVTMMTLGYDPARGRFVGTFVSSMMTDLWIYEGELSADGNTLTLDTEGPSFTTEGARSRYKDSMEFVTEDHRVLQSRHEDGNGGWALFMTQHFYRVT